MNSAQQYSAPKQTNDTMKSSEERGGVDTKASSNAENIGDNV